VKSQGSFFVSTWAYTLACSFTGPSISGIMLLVFVAMCLQYVDWLYLHVLFSVIIMLYYTVLSIDMIILQDV